MTSPKHSASASRPNGRTADFPVLSRKVQGKKLVYLDSAATSQKPSSVIKAISSYYQTMNANVHRGVHTLSQEATDAYEGSRERIAKFIGATAQELIFTKNTSEALNLVRYSWALPNLKRGDEIVLSIAEHHSNLVPWQTLKGVTLRFIDIDENGELKDWEKAITSKTRLVAISHASNVLGTINPIKEIARKAHSVGALIAVDGAQAAPHIPVDVKGLDVDFYAFSAHKMLGPTGMGALYGRRELLNAMEPFMYGGDMIKEVTKEGASWNDLPYKFEAGTPDISGAIGFGAAIDYLSKIGMKNMQKHEQELLAYGIKQLSAIKGLTLYGPKQASKKVGVLSFSMQGVHPHDIASILDAQGIAIRSGHLCAQPLMKRLGVDSLARASFNIYNSKEDIDALVKGILEVQKVFK